jgi:hypothetical protein
MLITVCVSLIVDEFKNEARGALTVWGKSYTVLKINIKWLLPIIIITFIFYIRMNDIRGMVTYLSWSQNERLEVYQKAEDEYKDHAKIYYYGSTSPAYALSLGDNSARKYNSEYLKKLYPHVYFYDFIEGKFYNWDGDAQFEEILSRHGKKIIIQGPPFDEIFSLFYSTGLKDLKSPNLLLKDAYSGNNEIPETIYEIDLPRANGSG